MISRVPLLHSLILAALVFLTYRSTLTFNFVWDDFLYVEQNTAIQSWAYLDDAFTSPQTTWSSDPTHTISEWRPIRNISFLIDHTLYGLNPTGWHLTNLILHAIATILLYHLIKRLINLATTSTPSNPRREATPQLVISNSELVIPTPSTLNSQLSTLNSAPPTPAPAQTSSLAALFGAAFWAVHPLQTEVVAWVKSRDDLLAAIFFIATLLVALPRRITNYQLPITNERAATPQNTSTTPSNPRREATPQLVISNLKLVISILLFICALLSKENTIILAALYPIILLLLFPSSLRAFVSKFALPKTPNSPTPSNPRREATPQLVISNSELVIIPTALFILTALAFLITRHLILGRTTQSDPLAGTPLNTLYTMLAAFTRYIQLILWPWPPTQQSADYDAYPIITNPLHPQTLTGAAILLALMSILIATLLRTITNYKLQITNERAAAPQNITTPDTPSKTLNSPPTTPHSPPTTPHFPNPSNPRREATPQLVISNSELVINPSPSSALTAIGLLILLLALLPYANIIPMMQILAERFLYLPLIGPALLLSTLILTLHRKTTTNTPSSTLNSQLSTLNSTPAPPSNPRRAATPQLVISNLELVIILLLILALTIQTTRRLPVWQNDIALFTSTLKSNPHSWRPPNNLAKALLKYGHTTPALHIITPALHQFPRDPDIVRTAAIMHLVAGHETTGTQLTQYATQLQPNDPRATKTLELYYNLKAKGQLP